MASETSDGPAAPRASGRVRKRPQTMYDASPGARSSKRRRSDGADGEDEDMIDYRESSSEEDEGNAETDDDAVVPHTAAKARKQPAQRKARPNGTTTLPIRQSGKKRVGKKALDGIDAGAVGGMFAELFAQHLDPQQIVSSWLERWEENEYEALAELVNFILRAAGCTSNVTSAQIENPDDVASAIGELQDEFQASNPTDYPLMQAKGRTASTVKQGVASLLDTLMKSLSMNGLLYSDPALMDNVQNWFATMSTAANRPFRHTATVVSLICTTSLCEVARDLAIDASKSKRQAETESKKAAKNKARISEIKKKVTEAEDRVKTVEGIIEEWYTTVFIHRYKDVDAAIRRECAAALGDWICILPRIYLDGSHLRYLGWMLSDTHPTVRLEAVRQITRFFKAEDMISGLRNFTEKFRSRLVEIATRDAEVNVRTAAIELLDSLREHGWLQPDDIDAVGRLIFESDDKVRKSAAHFLAGGIKDLHEAKLNELGGLEALEDILTSAEDNYTAPRIEWLTLKCIVEILEAYHVQEDLPRGIERARLGGELTIIAAGAESRFSLAAGALVDRIQEARDPRVVAGLLLADELPAKNRRKTNDLGARFRSECTLTEQEQLVMLDVLHVSLRQEVSMLGDKLKSSTSKRHQLEDQEQLEVVARHALKTIPSLLEHFGNSQDAVVTILRSVKVLRVPAVQDLGIEATAYQSLLDQIKKQFLSHTSDDVLSLAAQFIAQAKTSSELEEAASDMLNELWETSVHELVHSIDIAKVSQRGTASETNLRRTLNSLRRIALLSQVSDSLPALQDETVLAKTKARGEHKAGIDCIISLVQRAQTTRTLSNILTKLEDDVAQRASDIVLFYFRWSFVAIKQKVSGPNGVDIPMDELEALAGRRDRWIDTLSAILRERKAKEEVCVAFAGLLVDMHLASSTLSAIEHNPDMNEDYTIFISDMSNTEQKAVLRAFAGAESVYATLANKRLESASLTDGDVDDVDEDPLSEDEDDDDAAADMSNSKNEEKIKAALLAESRLCELTSKIVLAVLGSLMDKKSTRRRVERNKQKLGNNFKEVCKFFDLNAKTGQKLKAKTMKKTAASAPRAAVPSRKSNAIDADSEVDDEIEDVNDDDQAHEREAVDDVDDGMAL